MIMQHCMILAICEDLIHQICIFFWHSLLCFEFHFLRDLISDRKCYIKVLLLELRISFYWKYIFYHFCLFFDNLSLLPLYKILKISQNQHSSYAQVAYHELTLVISLVTNRGLDVDKPINICFEFDSEFDCKCEKTKPFECALLIQNTVKLRVSH